MNDKPHRGARVLSRSVLLILLGLTLSGLPAGAQATADGTSPDRGLAPAGVWDALSPGESTWYAFEYTGDRSQIELRLETEPDDSTGFSVWTPDQLSRRASGEQVQPVGRGSAGRSVGGILTWSGNFNVAGTYAILVEYTDNVGRTASYALSASGAGVLFSSPALAGTAGPAKTRTATKRQAALPNDLAGKLVFHTSYGGAFYTIDVDGSGLQRITTGIDPTWSPDGQQIAYVSWEEPRGVWVITSDGTSAHRVFDWTETRFPSWSPDGQEIVFSRSGSGGGAGVGRARPPKGGGGRGFPGLAEGGAVSGWTLGIVDANDGSFSEPLPASDTNLTPDWSPNGESIVFTGYHGLMVQSTDGRESWQITSDPRDTSPAWSPDGTLVACAHRQHDHYEIYIVDPYTGRSTRLTDTPAQPDSAVASSVSPAWSPDGKYIAFLTNRTGTWEIWVMEADGTNAMPLFDTELDGLTLQYAFAGERAIDWTR